MSLKVCIIGLKCFDYIAGNPSPRYLGGIETLLTLLAKGLAKENCQVSMVTYDHGQPDAQCYEGVTVYRSYDPEAGLPFLRLLHPRSTLLWQAMRRADADVYLQMGAGDETGRVAFGCRMGWGRPRRFAFCLASDANYGSHLRAGRFGIEGRMYQYGLRRADLVIAQTARQREGLNTATGIHSQVIPMAPAEPLIFAKAPQIGEMPRVAWIGRISQEKRLEWLLEVARRCPDIAFDIAGAPNRTSDYATRLTEDATQLPNVTFHGRLGPSQVQELYANSKLLCNTSVYEGFPATFLEAWSHGLPVVSTFDSDDIVTKNQVGWVTDSIDGLVAGLRHYLGDAKTYAQASGVAKAFYANNYSLPVVSRRFREALEGIVR